MRFHTLQVVSMEMTVFCNVAPCNSHTVTLSYRPDDGGSKHFRTIG
jgi:hypothetical protein